MHNVIRTAAVVLMGWMIGTGWLWADQTPPEAWQQREAVAAQTLTGGEIPSIVGLDASGSLKSGSKTIKVSLGASKAAKKKKTKKKSTKRSKKTKTSKYQKKSKSTANN
jgi:hypothetical protein